MPSMRTLLVEDDALVRQRLSDMLRRVSIASETCKDASDALALLRHELFDVIATDWVLSSSALDIDGVALARVVRELRIRTPILLYSAHVWTQVDIARALDAGVDDVMDKPIARFDEFVARLRALTRRSSGKIPIERIRVGVLEIDILGHAVQAAGIPLTLTRAQVDMLTHFAARAEAVLTYDEIHTVLGGTPHASKEERVHRVHEAMRRLRARLGAAREQIVNVPGVGYRLTARPGQ